MFFKRSDLSDLTDLVVHDLKNPLSIILTSAEILASGALDNDAIKRKSFLERIYEASKILSSRTTNIVDIRRVEEKKLTLKPEKFQLSQILSNLGWIKRNAERQNKTMTFTGEPSFEFEQDLTLTTRVLENLLLNAIKNTTANGIISMEIESDAGRMVAYVFDNGEFIPEKDLKKIYDKYYKAEDNVKNTSENTGLALTFCKQIVEAMKGKISVKSTEGVGTTFTVSF